jgi:hypothetical protein
MPNISVVNVKNKRAIELINKRATEENRSATNAATATIIEALSGRYGSVHRTPCTENQQEKTA